MTNKFEIFVISSSAYEDHGIVHGTWIDPFNDTETISAQINQMISEDPTFFKRRSDYVIHDSKGFYDFPIEQDSNIEFAHKVAKFLDEDPEIKAILLRIWDANFNKAQQFYDLLDIETIIRRKELS